MENKTIMITGATDGIGKATAFALAKQGHTIILHGRNQKKAETVQRQMQAETGNSSIEIFIADLLSLADVRRAALEFKTKHDRLDVLINNAGAFFNKDRETTGEKQRARRKWKA